MGPAQAIRSSPSTRDHLATKAGDGRKLLLAKDTVDSSTVFIDLFGLAYEFVNGRGIGEGAFGVEPPLLHAKDRVAADLFCIGRKQRVVETLQFGYRGSGPPLTMRARAGFASRPRPSITWRVPG